ncbi:MAG: hypothetical protein E6Q27_02830 [Aeromicrobium sp.]|nr:MAG: hypothetical protein E6Q27_02830 [Aeromicrobium sp.]
MWAMGVDTWVSLAVLMTALAGCYPAMRRDMGLLRGEVKSDFNTLRTEMKEQTSAINTRIDRIDDRITTLDDRIYGLAIGLKPIIDERETA